MLSKQLDIETSYARKLARKKNVPTLKAGRTEMIHRESFLKALSTETDSQLVIHKNVKT